MRKLVVFCGLTALLFLSASKMVRAQDQQSEQQPSDQNQTEETKPAKPKPVYKISKYELSAGYSYRTFYYPNQVTETGATAHMNGWYGSLDWNRFRWLGIIGEATGTTSNQGVLNGDQSIYSFLVGPQIYPFRHHRLTPFGHFLYGAGWYRDSVNPFSGHRGATYDSVVRSWEAGGGIDLSLNERWGVRLFQFDVMSADFLPATSTLMNATLKRVSFGVVYHFGKR